MSQRTETLGYQPTNEVRQGYTGYEQDTESGLDFAQARYYNSAHGRFTSVDPLTASANVKNPQTFNRYSYVLNSPYKYTDPLGLISSSTGACGTWCSNNDSSLNLGEAAYMEDDDENDYANGPIAMPPTSPPPPLVEQNIDLTEKQEAARSNAETEITNLYIDARGKAEKLTPPSVVRQLLDPLGAGEIVDIAISASGTVTGDLKPLGVGEGVEGSTSVQLSTNDASLDKNIGNTIQGFTRDIDKIAQDRDADINSVKQKLVDQLVRLGMSVRDATVTSHTTEMNAILRDNASVNVRGTADNVQYYVDARMGAYNPGLKTSFINRFKESMDKTFK